MNPLLPDSCIPPPLHPSPAPQNGLLNPLGSEWMAGLLTRLLIRNRDLRLRLEKEEAMDWAWINSWFRATVRSWFLRRKALAEVSERGQG